MFHALTFCSQSIADVHISSRPCVRVRAPPPPPLRRFRAQRTDFAHGIDRVRSGAFLHGPRGHSCISVTRHAQSLSWLWVFPACLSAVVPPPTSSPPSSPARARHMRTPVPRRTHSPVTPPTRSARARAGPTAPVLRAVHMEFHFHRSLMSAS